MRLIELASPFGVFLIGVILLAIGYSLYLSGLISKDAYLMDSGIPIENLGITLMISGAVLYTIVVLARFAMGED
jgi:hypothetical protein